jgi:hypothetical protein
MIVDRLRQVIVSQLALCDRLQMGRLAADQIDDDPKDTYDESKFDNLGLNQSEIGKNSRSTVEESDNDVAAVNSSLNDVVHPERKRISIPSTWKSVNDNNVRQIELDLRMLQAAKVLSALRDLIAEKSFQFSHVIRVAPRKGVRTRARSAIAKINNRIAFNCRVYDRSRAAMVKLGADDIVMNRFRKLERQDIASSTALLNPNEPGSSSQRLSWIWLSGRTSVNQDTLGLHECECQKYKCF